ncbi:hypothetical protein DYBT9623_05130 [Dyadobacter sp. CECT 9623]|jgi:hypothetical protein|uniref:Uncharacterized protein n=1 Tax=Dyadobacter linearis TaxID=2823330 RepID=A0ABM8UXQ6_9BACT|nr:MULTISPECIES: hypothetical protein [unclassified Dyadobacter]MCE7062786.1 hypothetical protein [Dyadobacter sp. CY343]CAG5074443.1 hypothetical protein DYBT9623_05130 [Dyadobacter sp. CECT 9623]
MKTLSIILSAFLASAGIASAQTTPVPTNPAPGQTTPQTTPTQQPATTAPATESKTDFNSPQSPVRPANIPSEDTLIKGQTSSGAVIKDTLVPSNSRKTDRMNRRKNKKGTAETTGDTSSVNKADSGKP